VNQASRQGTARQVVANVGTGAVLLGAEGRPEMWSSLKRVIIITTVGAIVDIVDDDGVVVFAGGSYPATGGIAVDNLTQGLFRTKQIGKGFKVKSSTADLVTAIVEVYDNPA